MHHHSYFSAVQKSAIGTFISVRVHMRRRDQSICLNLHILSTVWSYGVPDSASYRHISPSERTGSEFVTQAVLWISPSLLSALQIYRTNSQAPTLNCDKKAIKDRLSCCSDAQWCTFIFNFKLPLSHLIRSIGLPLVWPRLPPIVCSNERGDTSLHVQCYRMKVGAVRWTLVWWLQFLNANLIFPTCFYWSLDLINIFISSIFEIKRKRTEFFLRPKSQSSQ